MEHIFPTEKDDFEKKMGVTYYRRCGRVTAKDNDPNFSQKRECQIVKIDFRNNALGVMVRAYNNGCEEDG